MEQMLLKFQGNISTISDEIQALQQQSLKINIKAQNRTEVRFVFFCTVLSNMGTENIIRLHDLLDKEFMSRLQLQTYFQGSYQDRPGYFQNFARQSCVLGVYIYIFPMKARCLGLFSSSEAEGICLIGI